jgi:cell division protein FtsW
MLLVATAMLIIAGLLAVYSSSFAVGYHLYDDANFFIARQAVFALVGVGVMVFFMRMDYNRLRTLSVPMLGLALAGLLLVLIPGIGGERNGASRWLEFGPVSVQPSEWAKLAIIVYIAAWLASRGQDINKFTLGFVPFVLLMSIVGGLVVAEPDMGTTIIVVLTASTLFFVAGAPLSHLGLLLAAGGLVSYLVIQEREYQMDRLMASGPRTDPRDGFRSSTLIALGGGADWALAKAWAAFYIPLAHGRRPGDRRRGSLLGLIGVLGFRLLHLPRYQGNGSCAGPLRNSSGDRHHQLDRVSDADQPRRDHSHDPAHRSARALP